MARRIALVHGGRPIARQRPDAHDQHRLPRPAGGRGVLRQGCPLALRLLPHTRICSIHRACGHGMGRGAGLFRTQRQGLRMRWSSPGASHCCNPACLPRCRKCARWVLPLACTPAACTPAPGGRFCPHLDWVGWTSRPPEGDYARITATPGSGAKAFAGLQCLLASGVDFECRTTWHPACLPLPIYWPWGAACRPWACASGRCSSAAPPMRLRGAGRPGSRRRWPRAGTALHCALHKIDANQSH